MVDSIDIKKLNLDELVGVVNLYPWYGGARKELCTRMASMGDGWGREEFAAASLYVPSREIIGALLETSGGADCSDADVQNLLKAYFERDEHEVESASPERKVYVVGGDYFTKAQYENVRRSTDNIFSSFASKARSEGYSEVTESENDFDFCTEALAEIYAEQGYPAEAKKIYSKLSLRYPEKSVYFAALIEKLEEI